MSRLWKFSDYSEVAVACPELDAFIDDLDAVFKKHGVGVKFDSCSEYPKLTLKPYDGDLQAFTEHLDESRGIPWLDAAYEHWGKVRDEVYEMERRAEKAAKERKAEAERDAALKNGIVLAGKKYRLVEGD